jgi:hypothetical protein
MVAGMALAAFEIRRLQQGDQEAWFWVCVAGLMAVLGLAGVLGIGTGDDEAKL